ncbi:hypothetical protein [Plantactinospora sp. CA-290183]
MAELNAAAALFPPELPTVIIGGFNSEPPDGSLGQLYDRTAFPGASGHF